MADSTDKAEQPADPPPGLRQRKRQQTRERLTQTAMQLFLAQGFAATTIDEIAAAAEISRRSFFHYFASKEDLVFAWQDESDLVLSAALAAQPPAIPPLRAAEQALIAVVSQFERDTAFALAQLIHGTPTLQARDQIKYSRLERTLAASLSQRTGDPPDALAARLVAMVAVGALRVAAETWLAEGGQANPVEYAQHAFRALRAALSDE